jgi:hypothetical protein
MITSDKHNLEKMREQINLYSQGECSLSSLIDDLHFLRDTLSSNIEDKWEHNFTNYLMDLESVHSYILENRNDTIVDTNEIVEKALDNLIELIDLNLGKRV